MASYEEHKREIVGLYDRAAGAYEHVGIRFATYFGNLFIENLAIPAGARVLDVATGRGALLFPAAQKVGPNGLVIGIDLAPGMVEATTAEIRERQLTQAQACLMDGDYPDFPEQTFDYILCGNALHFLDYEHALPRFRRLLKPGGTLGIMLSYIPADDPENMVRWQWLFQLTKEVFPPDFVPPVFWTSPNRINTPEIITALLNQAGFDDVSARREETIMYFADEEDWWAWEWSQGSRFWVEGMSPEGRARFKTVAFEHLCRMKVADGIPMLWGALFAVARIP